MLPLTNEDKKARSLCGLPIPVGGVDVHPLKVKDVVLVGEDYYQYQLSLVTMFKKVIQIRSNLEDSDFAQINDFVLLFYIVTMHPSIKDEVQLAIEFFLSDGYKADINVDQLTIDIYNADDQLLAQFNEEQYLEFIEIIKHQNYLDKQDDDDIRPADDAARELMEQRKRAREMIAKAKGHKGEKLSLADYLSIASGKSLRNNTHFLDITIYSFYNYLERLMLIENYDVSLKQILAGADAKKIKIDHWAKKL